MAAAPGGSKRAFRQEFMLTDEEQEEVLLEFFRSLDKRGKELVFQVVIAERIAMKGDLEERRRNFSLYEMPKDHPM